MTCLRRFVISCSLAALAAQTDAAIQRWNVDVVGLDGLFQGISFGDDPLPPPVVFSHDSHGYFIADDLDGDGEISQAEVIDNKVLFDITYEQQPAATLAFHYAPASGLTYLLDGYHATVNFGNEARRFADTGSTVFRWTASTTTTISEPFSLSVPEPASLMLAMAGLSVVMLTRRRGVLQR